MRRVRGLVSTVAVTGVLVGSLPGCNPVGADMGDVGGAGGTGDTGGIVCRNYPSSRTVTRLWEQLTPSGSLPQARYGASAAYDRVHDTLLVFGGTNKTSYFNDMRALTNASGTSGAPSWTTVQVSGTPPSPRAHAVAAYNPVKGALFIFGGEITGNKIQTDLWELTNAIGVGGAPTWSSVPIAGAAPSPARGDMSGVYIQASDALVFFGGINCSTSSCTNYSDTFAINNLSTSPTWQKVSTGGAPPARYSHSSVYDTSNDRMIIFGGNTTTNLNGDPAANLDDVWALSNVSAAGASWRELTPTTGARPSALMGHTAVLDEVNGRMMVYGGVNTSNYVTGATLILSGLSSTAPQWLSYDTGSPVPTSRTLHVAAYSGNATNRMIMGSGSEGGGNYANDTWVLHNANGLPTTPVTRITIASGATTVCTSEWMDLTATAYDANGNEIDGVIVVWSSSDETIATVDAQGRVTAVARGTVTITATDQNGMVTGKIMINVVPNTGTGSGAGGAGGAGSGTGGSGGATNCTCYCGWPANMVCTTNSQCPPDESVPGTFVPGVCGCPIGCK
jgi:Bacterial Ig-like domain (group 2)/Galactose oxidase, central domain